MRLTGRLTESPAAGQDKELQVEAVDILGECNPEVPIPSFSVPSRIVISGTRHILYKSRPCQPNTYATMPIYERERTLSEPCSAFATQCFKRSMDIFTYLRPTTSKNQY